MKSFFFAVFLLFVPVSSHAQNVHLRIDPASEVRFTSKPPLRVVGKTNQVRGTVKGDLSDLSSFQAEFSLPLNSIDTRIKKRNKTMREKYLETEKYPLVQFRISRILSRRAVTPGEITMVEVEGVFDLHGISRKEKLVADVVYKMESGKLYIDAEFPIRLSDYQINQPWILFFKFSDVITISLKLVLSS